MFIKYFSHPKLQIFLAALILLVVIGTGAFVYFEGWSLLDALYFTVSTITTVGYGDLVPTHAASKIIATIYMVLMVPALLIGVGVVSEIVEERRGLFNIKKEK